MSEAQNPSIPLLTSDSDVSNAGFYHLSWEAHGENVELQEANTATFQDPAVVYRGPDRATVISGKPDGMWYYRVRELNDNIMGDWSEPVAVTVKHHSLARAFFFFGIGVVVFLATLVLLVYEAGKYK